MWEGVSWVSLSCSFPCAAVAAAAAATATTTTTTTTAAAAAASHNIRIVCMHTPELELSINLMENACGEHKCEMCGEHKCEMCD